MPIPIQTGPRRNAPISMHMHGKLPSPSYGGWGEEPGQNQSSRAEQRQQEHEQEHPNAPGTEQERTNTEPTSKRERTSNPPSPEPRKPPAKPYHTPQGATQRQRERATQRQRERRRQLGARRLSQAHSGSSQRCPTAIHNCTAAKHAGLPASARQGQGSPPRSEQTPRSQKPAFRRLRRSVG